MDLHLNKEKFAEVANEVSIATHVPKAIVEKDYFVTLFLERLTKNLPNIIFKGGTSLSKCYGIIKRFSEDIDITVDFDTKLTESGHKKIKDAIKQTVNELNLEIINLEDTKSKRDFNQYQIKYPSVFGLEALKQNILVETSVAVKAFPTETKQVKTFIQEFLEMHNLADKVDELKLSSFEIKVQTLDRTLVDKLFAIGDYYLQGKENGHSRHIYDIYKFLPLVRIDENFKKLVVEVRELRNADPIVKNITDGKNAHACQLSPEKMQKLLEEIVVKEAYKKDYDEKTSQLLMEEVSYKTAITALTEIIKKKIF